MPLRDSFGARSTLATSAGTAAYYRLATLEERGIAKVARLPFSIKVLLEAMLRHEDGYAVTPADVARAASYDAARPADREVPFKPARVLMQDFTGVPALVDLAAMRDAMARLGGDPARINPLIPVDLVIDHSVQVDAFGSPAALGINADREFARNRERYEFLHWGQKAFANFTVVPPASGICHQVNLEALGQVVRADGGVLFPDSLVGLDSHTPMINGLGVVGWGVGGIEAEAVLLGQPLYMLLPEVIGVELVGQLPPGSTATDLVLVVTQLLRKKGVVGKFIEFFGPGLGAMTVPDRATIANMSPEFGATISYFPVDDRTLAYLRTTGRPAGLVDRVERYCKEQGLFRTDATPRPEFTETLRLDLGTVGPSVAGPKRPQDRIDVSDVKRAWREGLSSLAGRPVDVAGLPTNGMEFDTADGPLTAGAGGGKAGAARLRHGDVVIAAITSCTNTSNPSVMIGAGLLARKAVAAGLSVPTHVKTSLAPGSKAVTGYLDAAGLLQGLETLGFHVVGYGCTTCIGNSGPLPDAIAKAVDDDGLVVAAVLSGNRNFEARIHPQVKANYLASPPLVIAYALAGTVDIDLTREPVGRGTGGDVFLRDLWPTAEEIRAATEAAIGPDLFARVYARLLTENETWNAIPATASALYPWDASSTYIQEPPFFVGMGPEIAPIAPIRGARVLVMVGDSITTDHISPAGAIAAASPAGRYLRERGVETIDFNVYGTRRGNDRVMTRGTFANVRLKNLLAPGTEGGATIHLPTGETTTIHEAAQRYQAAGTPLVVLAGKDYGMGSSRDWAAKGPFLLGVRAVIAESYERIHRSNLVGMGILPLQYREGESAASLGLTGRETLTIRVGENLAPGAAIEVDVAGDAGPARTIRVVCRIDTAVEVDYYRNGGILPTVLRRFARGE
jgi:aconitate hydratase